MSALLLGHDDEPALAEEDFPGPVIDLVDARKTYTTGDITFEALRGVTLRIDRGEYVAIMGPSGSGKSTLMNILGCLDVLTSGSYALAGHDVADLDEEDLADIRNREVGFVFQQFHLLPSLSAKGNVMLPLTYRHHPGQSARAARRAREEAALGALDRVGLADKAPNRPGQMSGGQQQRVAVARALVGEPALILADEPTGNLDSSSTDDVLALFDELHASGRTVVLITHEDEVASRAARVVRVRDGLIAEDTGARSIPVPGTEQGATA